MPTTPRDRYLRSRYGIDEQQYDALAAVYDGGCWVCMKKPKPGGRRHHLDHDHHSKRVRGILCWRHNAAIEQFQDNPGLLRAAATYLESDLADQVLAKLRARLDN